jgi:hypothetical protein
VVVSSYSSTFQGASLAFQVITYLDAFQITVATSAFVSGASVTAASVAAASSGPGSVVEPSLEKDSCLQPSCVAVAARVAAVGVATVGVAAALVDASLVVTWAYPFVAILAEVLLGSFCEPFAVARPSSCADFSASSFAAVTEWLACGSC